MKNVNLFLIVSIVMLIFACEESNDSNFDEITGTYVGTISKQETAKTSSLLLSSKASAEVTLVGDQIEVHCFGGELDTTILLDYYQDHDSVFVCHTGEEFEQTYGHMKGNGHMSGGMMGDMHNGETEWMHHLNDEHKEGDEHFGGFDMEHQSFSYSFTMEDGDYLFEGKK